MRALDTNILVRYVVADDPKQLALVESIIEECGENEEPVFLSVLVLCELVWVLDRSYQQSKAQMLEVMDTVLRKSLFRIEHHELVRRSVHAWRHGRGDFAGYLIGEIARHAGCRDIVTFDRGLKGSAGFTFLS